MVRNKGFAFLKGTDGIERFFHRSAVMSWVNFDNLSEGDAVTFEEDRSPKGPRAKNIDIDSEAHGSDTTAQATTEKSQIHRAQTDHAQTRHVPVGEREAEDTGRARSHRGRAAGSVHSRRAR